MGSRKADGKASRRNPRHKPSPLAPNKTNTKQKQKKQKVEVEAEAALFPASEQLSYFLDQFQSTNVLKLSSLELQAIKDTSILELSQDLTQDASSLGTHMKAAFGSSWKEVLFRGELLEGKIDPGNPALIVISASALQSLELLRGLRPLTRECQAAKLFSKHMKVEEQVSLLKHRVNIASGTPSRIKKLIDMEALGLSRLSVIVLDMHADVKGYSLFSLPQVRDEFWDLYKSYFHERLVLGNLRICLYGPFRIASEVKTKK